MAGLGGRFSGEPGREADQIDRGRGGNMLQVRLGLTYVSGLTQAEGAYGLGERSFNAGAPPVFDCEARVCLACAGRLEGQILLLGTDHQNASR